MYLQLDLEQGLKEERVVTERNSNRPNIKVYNIEDMDLDLTWPAHFWRPPVPLSPFFKMAEKIGILDLTSNFKI